MRKRATSGSIPATGLVFGLALALAGSAAAWQEPTPTPDPTPAQSSAQAAADEVAPSTCSLAVLRNIRVMDAQPVRPHPKPGPKGQLELEPEPEVSNTGLPRVELRDTIAVRVQGLDALLALETCLDKIGPDRKILLYLDDRPVIDATAYPPTDPGEGILMFPLRRSESSRDLWTFLLGRPKWDDRPVKVSVGLNDLYAVSSDIYVDLRVIPRKWFFFWLALFLVFGGGFLVLAKKSNLLRDPVPTTVGTRLPYSLSRTQAAWWFFLVLGSYLLIGMITGDFSTTITSTVLVLLGISAGTAVGSAFVDASQTSVEGQAAEAALAQSLRAEIAQLDQELKTQRGKMEADPADVATARDLATKAAMRAEKYSKYRKLTGQSEQFLLDILSDTGGVNFHRFQMAAWTVVLGFIFIGHVYRDLAMPEFSTTLLGLMGISAGTFLGLKIPEKPKPDPAVPADPADPAPPTP
jgi:hypothetical protein